MAYPELQLIVSNCEVSNKAGKRLVCGVGHFEPILGYVPFKQALPYFVESVIGLNLAPYDSEYFVQTLLDSAMKDLEFWNFLAQEIVIAF